MKLPVYNVTGEKSGEVAAPAFLSVSAHPALLHQVLTVSRARRRSTIASTKKRGQVRGGGKKPWQQKGTGRARQGSIRSPQWVGGGVVFGPNSARNFELDINKRDRRRALAALLADRAQAGMLVLVESFNDDAKTKTLASLLATVTGKNKINSILLVSEVSNEKLKKAVRNLSRRDLVVAATLNVLDVMQHDLIVMTTKAFEAVEKQFPEVK